MTLIEHLSVVEETRSGINQKHDLVDVIFLVISAIMAGAEGWQDIQTYGDAKQDWLKQYRPFEHGIPRRHTIAQILKSIVAESLFEALLNWVLQERWLTIRSIIAIERHRTENGKGSVDTYYYVRSKSPKHKLLGHYIRQHWWIENSQHYVLDVVFKEDNSRIMLAGAANGTSIS